MLSRMKVINKTFLFFVNTGYVSINEMRNMFLEVPDSKSSMSELSHQIIKIMQKNSHRTIVFRLIFGFCATYMFFSIKSLQLQIELKNSASS